MRNGDAIANAGGTQRFPGQENPKKNLPIHLVRQSHGLDDRPQDRFLIAPAQTVEDSPRLQRIDKSRKDSSRTLWLLKNFHRNVDLFRGCPFQQLCPVEAVLFVDPVGWETTLVDPSIDGLLGDIHDSSGVANGV